MSELLDQAALNSDVHVVVLKGDNQVFTSGNDVNAFSTRNQSQDGIPATPASILFIKSIIQFPKPIIAQVEGMAIGIGSTMLLHCDLIFATPETYFLFPFVNLGLVPEAASTYLLPRIMGPARATELILTGEKISSEKALQYGLINQICAADQIHSMVQQKAKLLAQKPPQALQLSKKLLRDIPVHELLNRVEQESDIFSHCIEQPEFKEALTAFREKRAPNFKNALLN